MQWNVWDESSDKGVSRHARARIEALWLFIQQRLKDSDELSFGNVDRTFSDEAHRHTKVRVFLYFVMQQIYQVLLVGVRRLLLDSDSAVSCNDGQKPEPCDSLSLVRVNSADQTSGDGPVEFLEANPAGVATSGVVFEWSDRLPDTEFAINLLCSAHQLASLIVSMRVEFDQINVSNIMLLPEVLVRWDEV